MTDVSTITINENNKAKMNTSYISLFDSHVHIYDCFDLALFFDNAHLNFKRAASRCTNATDFTGILMLAERSSERWFQNLVSKLGIGDGENTVGNWRISFNEEDESINLRDKHNNKLILIPGHQVVSNEGLEVLALCTQTRFTDGAPIVDLIDEIRSHNAIVVIPWGVGKWFGKRGQVVKELIQSGHLAGCFLGDIIGRPVVWPKPDLFTLAVKNGVRILPGTDPLPLAPEAKIPGRYGAYITAQISDANPTRDIKKLLTDASENLVSYGHRNGVLEFMRKQISIRI